MVASRRILVGFVLAVAVACSGPPARDVDVAGPTTSDATTTTTVAATTTVPVPPDVEDLMVATTMTDRARRLFLAAAPAVEDASTFTRSCGLEPTSGGTERTHTSGCYVAGHIHLLAPDRPEARDLLYVVAAHELLHAVYASLGPAERSRIDAETAAASVGNERLEERLKPYGSTPTLPNEMHSILGSEFDGLSPVLEAHYAQYFANRAAILAARQRTLGTREDEIRRLKASVDDLDAQIEALKSAQEDLRTAGNTRAYNAQVPVINALIGRYNAQVDALNAQVDEYNRLLGA